MPALIIIVLMLVIGTASYKLLLKEPAAKPNPPVPKAAGILSEDQKIRRMNAYAIITLIFLGILTLLRQQYIEIDFVRSTSMIFMIILAGLSIFVLLAGWVMEGLRPPLIASAATTVMITATAAAYCGVFF